MPELLGLWLRCRESAAALNPRVQVDFSSASDRFPAGRILERHPPRPTLALPWRPWQRWRSTTSIGLMASRARRPAHCHRPNRRSAPSGDEARLEQQWISVFEVVVQDTVQDRAIVGQTLMWTLDDGT